jgi:hypothetical protein
LFNQGVDHVVALLRSMAKFPFADKEKLLSAQTEIEEVRCDTNADFADHLADSERFDEGRFSKQSHDYESSGENWMTLTSMSSAVKKNERRRDCRLVSVLFLIR